MHFFVRTWLESTLWIHTRSLSPRKYRLLLLHRSVRLYRGHLFLTRDTLGLLLLSLERVPPPQRVLPLLPHPSKEEPFLVCLSDRTVVRYGSRSQMDYRDKPPSWFLTSNFHHCFVAHACMQSKAQRRSNEESRSGDREQTRTSFSITKIAHQPSEGVLYSFTCMHTYMHACVRTRCVANILHSQPSLYPTASLAEHLRQY